MPDPTGSPDVLIVGSGPAGAMAARDLARAGARVTVLERGAGADPGNGLIGLLRRREAMYIAPGVLLLRSLRVGGGSVTFFHTAMPTPLDMFARRGVDLAADLAAVRDELPNAPLRDDLRGPMTRRIEDAARALGLPWQPLSKMIDQTRCAHGHCPPQAFWTAQGLLDQAAAAGARLLTGVQVDSVLRENGRAVGVRAHHGSAETTYRAGRIVLAAGGTATPAILRASGIDAAGDGFFCDPLRVVMATLPDAERHDEISMSAGFVDGPAGYMLSDITVPENFFRAFALAGGRPDRLWSYSRTAMIMVKIRDDIAGTIDGTGRAWRHFGAADKARMRAGVDRARAVLAAAGASRTYASPWVAAHPGGTVRLGELVDASLRCQMDDLYVCDASVIPEPWGLPPTLTLLALGRYLARKLG